MRKNYTELLQQLLAREFTRREFLLYALALVPAVIGINGLLKKLLETSHPLFEKNSGALYGGRPYGK